MIEKKSFVNTMDSFASGFAAVDGTGDACSFVTYLDLIHSMPFFQECKRQSYRKLGIRPGASVLEIGCGNGVDAIILAGMTGPEGRVTGIDVSSTMLASARTRDCTGIPSPHYVLCDASYLAFSDDMFDAARADRVLQHTTDPATVVREMARVTRPTGKIVVFEPDWETFALWPGEREVTRRILNFWCDRIPSGWAGRSLYGAFRTAGLSEVSAEPMNLVITNLPLARKIFDLETTVSLAVGAGIVSSRETETWSDAQVLADEAGQFFSSLTFYMVTGTKRG
ncbi:MAG: methyltransferase domain-containing protein [Methanoregula sp.]|jgi:ubiquinone/menaquinone biosynthesis C-methylase UbiE|uniref:methyltransferase domain-containing protein n=1 Tax=Methanoregula sp. TaxID=2052170 RepID=UPI0025F16707|nr:methyltransferase domain-containing protein [Methanoregula sp.]MCK9632435.1 methyltransferase domain-containing protein [Methanoregula sp.]